MQVSLADTETEHEDLILPNNEKLRWKIRGEDERKSNNTLQVWSITAKQQKITVRP